MHGGIVEDVGQARSERKVAAAAGSRLLKGHDQGVKWPVDLKDDLVQLRGPAAARKWFQQVRLRICQLEYLKESSDD